MQYLRAGGLVCLLFACLLLCSLCTHANSSLHQVFEPPVSKNRVKETEWNFYYGEYAAAACAAAWKMAVGMMTLAHAAEAG